MVFITASSPVLPVRLWLLAPLKLRRCAGENPFGGHGGLEEDFIRHIFMSQMPEGAGRRGAGGPFGGGGPCGGGGPFGGGFGGMFPDSDSEEEGYFDEYSYGESTMQRTARCHSIQRCNRR